jgi:16S rRNA (guanine966-N2)-methyltransferase
MRIISGSARGTKLYTLEGLATRPTLDRVKESLFNIIQSQVLDCVFLDLFAGSGAIGLEAASRGAKQAILVEKSPEAVSVINKNIEKTHLKDKVMVYQDSFKNVLSTKVQKQLDFIYLDPPYQTQMGIEAITICLNSTFVTPSTTMILETDLPEMEQELQNLPVEVIDKRRYGRATLYFIKKSPLTE